MPDRITGTDGREQPSTRPAPKPEPDLTSDILRALAEAGTGGMTAWQLAFLIAPAGPDSERAELTVLMAPALERLAREGRARVVGEVDGGQLWALAELVDAQTPEPVAAAPAAVADPAVNPEPKPTLRLVPDPDQVRAAEQRDARALLSRGVDLLAPARWNDSQIRAWIEHLGADDEELAALKSRARAAIAVLSRIIEEAGR